MIVSIHDEHGGVVAKLLGLIVVVAVLGGAALYVYSSNQRPLAFDGIHTATNDARRDPHAVAFARGVTISIATVVRNVGRLPITLEGLALDPASHAEPLMPVSIGLGDGRTTTPSTTSFAPPELDPGSGIGVVITYGVNPNVSCDRFAGSAGAEAPLPPVELRFSSYGVESTQAVSFGDGAPTVDGITRDRCEAVTS